MTEVPTSRNIARKIDVSLRFWSINVPFGSIAQRLDLKVDVLHNRNDKFYTKTGTKYLIAENNYLCAEHYHLSNIADVFNWCVRILDLVSKDGHVLDMIKSKSIDAAMNVAVFPSYSGNNIQIEKGVVGRANSLGIKIWLEDYKNLLDGNPRTLEF